MAWLDDRAWCHPKLVNLTDRSFRAYINGISYAAGMGTGGTLTEAQQKLCGADYRSRAALIKAGLWDAGDGLRPSGGKLPSSDLALRRLSAQSITIHDWQEHNGKRDARRKADRERKRIARGFAPKRPQDSPQDNQIVSAGQSADSPQERPHAEGSENKKDQKQALTSKADVTANRLDPERTLELGKIIEVLRGVDDRTWNTLQPLAAQVPRSVLADLRTRATGKGPGWVVRALQAEIKERAA